MRYGSLFSGYGGLDLGIQSVLGGDTAWHCEIEPAPAKILAHHWPDVPNLGDITAVDWDAVDPIDVLTGGFPCQDVSHAGKRLGLKPGTRSGLWAHMAYAIDKLRPALVVAENVRGLLSAEAGGDLEPCPWCVGNGERGALRALGAILGDLADLGYDAQWVGVRAADAGAPHGRFRVFVYAWPAADAIRGGLDGWAPEPIRRPVERAAIAGRGEGPGDGIATPDADRLGHERPGSARGRRGGPADGGVTAADADGHGSRRDPQRLQLGVAEPDAPRGLGTAWREYEPAIRRWEHILGRLVPPPTEPGKHGQPRLSPAFVEWMMGLPAGHVTGVGLTRNEQLGALGNGVVPAQAALATRMWLATASTEVAA